MLSNLSCNDFLEELASNSPAPGGGSVAAFAGALSAALVSMVANLTIGKEKFKEQEPEFNEILNKATDFKCKLKECIDKDTEAFNQVMEAYKLPKTTEKEKAIRTQCIQKELQNAASLPMQVAEMCLEVLKLVKICALRGNSNAISDTGVAALMGLSGLQGALFNVDINLNSIKDEYFVEQINLKKGEIFVEAQVLKDEIMQIVQAGLKN